MARDPTEYFHAIPFTGYRRPNSLAAHGQGPERLYSHGIGGSDRFYGRQFQDDGRDRGYSHTMAQGSFGRPAPYNMAQARFFAGRRRRS
jgi:hypothetical protein